MMAEGKMILIVILIIASVVLFGTSSVALLRRTIRNKRMPERFNKAGISSALIFSLFLMFSIWILRFAVGLFAIETASDGAEQLTPLEEFVNSLFVALRTFSMEEEYNTYVIDINNLVEMIIPAECKAFHVVHFLTVAYASLLNLIAPVIGGAIILEILSSIFPKVNLRLSYLKRKRPKYFFSELNAASLALAKSIYHNEKRKPVLIFTDTYVDDENEKEYELLLEAKMYGAICIRDDLTHIAKTTRSKCFYFLMDENEFGNLQTLVGMTDDYNIRYINNSEIYLFVQTDAYVQVEKQVNKILYEYQNNDSAKEFMMPTIIPVRGYRNLVHNLFVDVPLYEPLINKTDKTKLDITILGNGIIGTEAFLSAYWFGQMLISSETDGKHSISECEMTINVVSKDSEDVFWSKIDYVNPEIRQSVRIIKDDGSVQEGSDEILKFNSDGELNNAYCNVRYRQFDVKIGGFWEEKSKLTKELFNTDYFIVALGNDADNISIAEKLRRTLAKRYIEQPSKRRNTVITYAVFDSELAKNLNKEKRYYIGENNQDLRNKKAYIYMHAFGSLDQVYSCDNIYMSKHSIWASETGSAYHKLQPDDIHINDNKKRIANNEGGDYEYWANLARASHAKYKVFSLGWIKKSIFDYHADMLRVFDDEKTIVYSNEYVGKCNDVSADSYHRDIIKSICENYKRVSIVNHIKENDKNGQIAKKDLELKQHCLAWLEHRRWNAFTRTMGYQHADVKNIFDANDSQKDMQMKLHACLVEARFPELVPEDTYIYAKLTPDGNVDTATMFDSFDTKKLDCLDEVSYERKRRKPDKPVTDFKMHDYYRYEFVNYLHTEELAELLKVEESYLVDCCKNSGFKGAVEIKEYSEWYVPYDTAKTEIKRLYTQLNLTEDEKAQSRAANPQGNYDKIFELFDDWYVPKA